MALPTEGDEAAEDPSPDFDSALHEGLLLEERYRIVRLIGRGGMGEVYEARHVRLDRRVAVKVLRHEYVSNTNMKKRFEREARAAGRLETEHVVTVFDFGYCADGRPFLVMEYLEGTDLRAVLKKQGSLTAPRAVNLALQVCRGLHAAHGAGVVHRDLKPENLFLLRRSDGSELCKILDFGLAKLWHSTGSDLHTREGVPIGTLNYMSPEQARGDKTIDERTDIYSLAAILYESISGKRVHTADTAHALLYKIIHEDPQPLDAFCEFVPSGLSSVVKVGLARDAAARPASIEEFERRLEVFAPRSLPVATELQSGEAPSSSLMLTAAGETSVETALSARSAQPRPARRSSRRWVLVAAGVLAASTAIAFVAGRRLAPEPAAAEPSAAPPPVAASKTAGITPPPVAEPPPPSAAASPAASTPSAPPPVVSRVSPVSARTAGTAKPAAKPASAAPRASAKGSSFDRSNPYD